MLSSRMTSKACSENYKQKVEDMPTHLQEVEDTATYLKTIPEGQFSENVANKYTRFEQTSVGRPLSENEPDKNGIVGTLEQADIDAVTIYTKDRDGDTLLHLAIILKKSICALSFISKAPTHEWLSFKNQLFQTPLHLAAIGNQPEVVRELVVAGADVTSQDKDGYTAIHIACRDGNLNVLTSLFQPVQYNDTKLINCKIPCQEELSIRNYDGLTCLHLAAMHGHLNIVELLITNNTDIINIREGKSGRTVLHNACQSGHIDLVKLLLGHRSCDINARAFDGYTPFDLARARRHDHICTFLAAAGTENEKSYASK